ncbi:MAG: DUF3256 family protein [Bacteroidales bacterium]|nr:DUF3256 family protein [Bacteroidales bacterium]
MIRYLFTIIAIIAPLALPAQMTPRSVVTTAPEKLLLTIDASTLLDMLDYYESGMAKKMANKTGEDAVITEMTDYTITIKTGECHDVTFAILPHGDSPVIMVIDRVQAPDTDAVVAFYNSRWKQLNTNKLLRMPTLNDWVGKQPRDSMNAIKSALPFLMADAQYDAATSTLTFTPSIGDYVSVEDAEMVKSAIAPKLAYVWTGKKFKPAKR